MRHGTPANPLIERLAGEIMRKTNRNIKRVKFFKRFVPIFVIGHVVILFAFLCILESKPVDISNCKNERIVVEDKEYIDIPRHRTFFVIANDIKYFFSNSGIFGKYSASELNEEIEIGETLDISYYKTGLFKKKNYVIAAEGEDVYLEYDTSYELKQKGYIGFIVLFSIIELIFASVLTLWFISASKELKFFSKKKRKTRKQSEQANDIDDKIDPKP